MEVGGQAVLGRQSLVSTPWLTERHGYDPTCGLVGSVPLTALSDGVGLLSALDQVSGRSTGRVGALDVTADGQGLRLGEFDMNILTVEARELAVKLVGVLGLVQIELGSDEAGMAAAVVGVGVRVVLLTLELARVVIEVAEQTEERGEAGDGVVEATREESHFVGIVWNADVQMGCLEQQSCRWFEKSVERFC